MEVVYPRCCGLDVHKRELVACLLITEPDGTPRKAVRAFGTMTEDILALGDWLAVAGCTHLAMESTGGYWKPVWNLLEDAFNLLLGRLCKLTARAGSRRWSASPGSWRPVSRSGSPPAGTA